MTYLSDRSRTRRSYKYYFLLVIFFGLLLYKWPVIRTSVYSYAEPIVLSYGWTKGTVGNIPSFIYTYFTSHRDLVARNKSLELTIERLENELAEKDAIIKESEFAKKENVTSPQSVLILYPVMQDITKIYSTILLSKGFKDGVEEQSLVYVRGRQAVCTITEVHDKTSLCKLLSAGGETTEGVTTSSTTSATLFFHGLGGGAFVADTPNDTNVSTGDVITLKSNQTMILGTVTNIIHNDQASSWYVYVRGAYNPVTSNVFYISK